MLALSLFLARSAQAESSSIISGQDGVQPEAYVMKVLVDKGSYSAGDTIKGLVQVFNGTKTSLGALDYQVQLGGTFDDAGNAGVVFGTARPQKIALGPKEKKTIPFTYVIPSTASGKDVRVMIYLSLPSGEPLGSGTSLSFDVTGGSGLIDTVSGYVLPQVNGKPGQKFGIQLGVPVYDTPGNHPTAASVHYSFENKGKSSIQVFPKVTVYKRSIDFGEAVASFGLKDTQYTISPGASFPVSFDIPTAGEAPGVYEGKLELLDKDGMDRNEILPFRYVIQGPSAMIQSVMSDVSSVTKGQEFNVSVGVTGEAPDIYYDATDTTGFRPLRTEVKIVDASGVTVAQGENTSQVGPAMVTAVIPMKARQSSDSMIVHAKIYFGDTLLYSYDELLSVGSQDAAASATSSSRQPSLDNNAVTYLALSLVVLALVILLAWKFGHSRMLSLLFVLSLASLAGAAHAQYSSAITGTDPSFNSFTSLGITFNTPADNQSFAPGTPLKLSGTVGFENCFNRDTWPLITYNDGAGQHTSVVGIDTILATGSEISQRNNPIFSHTFTATTTPGTYIASVSVALTADGSANGAYTYRTEYQPYTVTANSYVDTVIFNDVNGNGVMDAGEKTISASQLTGGSACTTNSSYQSDVSSVKSYASGNDFSLLSYSDEDSAYAWLNSNNTKASAAKDRSGTSTNVNFVTKVSSGYYNYNALNGDPYASSTMRSRDFIINNLGGDYLVNRVADQCVASSQYEGSHLVINPAAEDSYTAGVASSTLPQDASGNYTWTRTTPDAQVNSTNEPDIDAGGKTYTLYQGIMKIPVTPTINGACGPAALSNSLASPAQSALCSAGTPTSVSSVTVTYPPPFGLPVSTPSPSFTWSCLGTGTPDAGTTASCSESKCGMGISYCSNVNTCATTPSNCNINGACGLSKTSTVIPTSANGACLQGSIDPIHPVVDNGQSFSWQCLGPNQTDSPVCRQNKCSAGLTYCAVGQQNAGTCQASCPPVAPVATTTLMVAFSVNPKIVRATSTPCAASFALSTNSTSTITCSLDNVIQSPLPSAKQRIMNFNVGIHTVTCVVDYAIQSTTTKCSLVPHYSNK